MEPPEYRKVWHLRQVKQARCPSSPQAERLFRQGLQCFVANRNAEAAEFFLAAAKTAPSWVDPLINLAAAYRRLGQPDAALDALKEAERLFPDSAIVHGATGTVLLHANRPKEAARELKIAHEIDPNDQECLINLCVAYRRSGQNKVAANACHKYLFIHGSDFGVLHNLSLVQRELGDLRKSSISEIRAIRALPSSHSPHYLYLAKILFEMGHLESTKRVLTREISKYPEQPETDALLAMLHVGHFLKHGHGQHASRAQHHLSQYVKKGGRSHREAQTLSITLTVANYSIHLVSFFLVLYGVAWKLGAKLFDFGPSEKPGGFFPALLSTIIGGSMVLASAASIGIALAVDSVIVAILALFAWNLSLVGLLVLSGFLLLSFLLVPLLMIALFLFHFRRTVLRIRFLSAIDGLVRGERNR